MTHGGSAPNQTKESVFETKKRSRSLNLPSSKKGHARVRADNNNDDPFSYLFWKMTDFLLSLLFI